MKIWKYLCAFVSLSPALELGVGLSEGALLQGTVMNEIHLQSQNGAWEEGPVMQSEIKGSLRQDWSWGGLALYYGNAWFGGSRDGEYLPMYTQRFLTLDYRMPFWKRQNEQNRLSAEWSLAYRYSTTQYATEYLSAVLPSALMFNPGTGLGSGMSTGPYFRYGIGRWQQSLGINWTLSSVRFADRALPYLGIRKGTMHQAGDLSLVWELGWSVL